MSRALWLLCAVLFCLTGSVSNADAQVPVELHAALSTDLVEVGEAFIFELSAMGGDQVRFSDPLLRLPAGFSANGPSIGSKTLVQMGANGTMFRRGISAKWSLVASAAGTYTLPAPSVRVDGRITTADSALRVTVVEPGRKPGTRPSAQDPFGMGMPFDDPLGDFLKGAQQKRQSDMIIDEPVSNLEALGETGRARALAKGDDPYVFLRIVPEKSKVVVGEQVTLRYYEYYRVTNERFDEREPKLQDFLRVPLDDEPGQVQRVTTSVEGRVWFVQELDSVAVFPLRTGVLRTGKLSAQFRVPFLKNARVARESNEASIEVSEPPTEKRPLGYRIGDVGQFALTATVAPRETVAGETVSVAVRLEGRGIMPNQLKLPERTGVEWLSPEKKDKSDLQKGEVGGFRTFGYAVRIVEQGDVELGSIELPYYDPHRHEYQLARVALGRVTVRAKPGGASAPKPSNAPESEPFATMPKARMSLLAYEPQRTHAPKLPWFLSWLLSPSLAVVLGGLLFRNLRTLGERRTARRTEPEHLARRALIELKGASDGPSSAALAERAVHHALEAATGLKSRGVLLLELSQELEARGLASGVAARARNVLDTCAVLRFQPGPASEDSAQLKRDAASLVQELLLLDLREQA